MSPVNHRALVDPMTDALNRNDWDALRSSFTQDVVIEFPQSGERFRGIDNVIGQFANYPGGLVQGRVATDEVISSTTYALTPRFTVVQADGSGTRGTGVFRVAYPDGSTWWVINMHELEGDRVRRARLFFAPVFDAPDWRAPFREAAGEG